MNRRLAVAVATLLPFAAAAQQASGSYAIIGSYTVNNGANAQTDPHVSGDFVAYTNDVNGITEIRVHQLGGSDSAIPNGGNADSLSDISKDRIVFTRNFGSTKAVHVYEISTAVTYELDPVWFPWRDSASIGSDTAAWVDSGLNSDPLLTQVVAYDFVSWATTRLSNDKLRHKEPAVSPDGKVIVWTRCQRDDTGCDVLRADPGTTGAWTVTVMTGADEDGRPATDGAIIAYESVRKNAAGVLDRDIWYQPVAGGAETQLPLTDGVQQNVSVAGGLIAFESRPDGIAGNFDIFLYDTKSGFLYQLTSTGSDERLTDIDIDPATGIVTLVYVKSELDENVYALRFTLVGAPSSCTGIVGDEAEDPATATCANPGTLEAVASATVTRTGGTPDVATLSWTGAAGSGLLCVANGAPTGNRTTSGRVILNGTEAVSPRDFFQKQGPIGRGVELASDNAISAIIDGEPGASFTVTVFGQIECGTATLKQTSALRKKGFSERSLKVVRGKLAGGATPSSGNAGCSSTSGGASLLALFALIGLAYRARRAQPERAVGSGRR